MRPFFRYFGTLMLLVASSAYGDGEAGIKVLPKDYIYQHRYIYLTVYPPAAHSEARVAFQQCEERSDPGKPTSVVPECRAIGFTGGYTVSDVELEGSKGKPRFFTKLAIETGAIVASGLTAGTAGTVLGLAVGAANIDNESGWKDLKTRRNTQIIAQAAKSAKAQQMSSKLSDRDLTEVVLQMVRDLEKKRIKADKIRPNDVPASTDQTTKPDTGTPDSVPVVPLGDPSNSNPGF